jgi:HEAT repeat protein
MSSSCCTVSRRAFRLVGWWGTVLCLAALARSGAADTEEPSFRGRPLSDWVKELKAPEAEMRRQAAVALSQMGPAAKPAVNDLGNALKDEDATVRLTVVTALWRLGPDAQVVAPAVAATLKKDRDQRVRTMAAYALGKVSTSTKEVVPALLEALQDEQVGVRRVAAFVLGQLPVDDETRKAVPTLVRLVRDEDELLRKNASLSLKKIDPAAAARAGVP